MVTGEELIAGLDALNASSPADFSPPPFLASYRHLCMGTLLARRTGRGVSEALDLKERYVTSWAPDGTPREAEEGAELAIIYREGTCRKCKLTARSAAGQVVRCSERSPLHGRVARA